MTARPTDYARQLAPTRVWLLVGLAAAQLHCEAAWIGLASLAPLLMMIVGLTVVVEVWRRLIGPTQFDGQARRVADAAKQLGLPAPAGALGLKWQSPLGFRLEAKAPDRLELSLPLAKQVPASLGVDHPNLSPGQVLAQVDLPDPQFKDFLVYGLEAEVYGLLTAPVRAALRQASKGSYHVAVEQGKLRVRLHRGQSGRVREAVNRLEAVAQTITPLARDTAQRLCDQVRSDDHRPIRQRALHLLLEGFEDSDAATTALKYAQTEALDEQFLQRWAARHSGGALSLTPAESPEGAVSILQASGGLSVLGDDESAD